MCGLKVEHGTDDVKLSTKCMNLAVEACNIGANGLIRIAQQKQEAAERKVDNLEQQVRIERRRHMQCIVKLAAARLDASRKEVIVTVTVSVTVTLTVSMIAIVFVTVLVTVVVVITFTGVVNVIGTVTIALTALTLFPALTVTLLPACAHHHHSAAMICVLTITLFREKKTQ